MKQQTKSQRSKELILDAGLKCFSSQGFRGTSMKDIAQAANISIGRVYHHFESKTDIFTTLLDHYWSVLEDPQTPLNQLIQGAHFPDDIPELARAIRTIVEQNKQSIMLIYIDVIEFHGEHINRVYRNMAANFRSAYQQRFDDLERQGELRQSADPLFAVMLTYRFFFHYFLVESSFGVADHFGFSSETVIEKTNDLILHGLLASRPDP